MFATRSRSELTFWLASHIARTVGLGEHEVDVNLSFVRIGIDSLGATHLIAALSEYLGRPLLPTLVWEHPTIAGLAAYLSADPSTHPPGVAPRQGTEARPAESVTHSNEPIAIVGMACRFPGAPDLDSFWQLLTNGIDAIQEVPASRWNAKELYDPDASAVGKLNTRWGGFVDNIDRFDPQFFGISPREAVHMDPQQRLCLELAWEALEDAGIVAASHKGSRTGVFIGTLFLDHAVLQDRAGREAITAHTSTGGAACIIANRISYAFGLQGPSLTVDTACSSSIVAMHLACQSLRSRESSVAIAGGVSLMLVPETTMGFSKLNAMSPDGRCRAFSAQANGYVRSEGAGLVVLKRLADAVRDGDRIYAVVRGTAVNNDGASNGLTAPNPLAQQAMLRDALHAAGVQPADIQYVEAHGTGTPLGDPIEAGALGAVLGAARPKDHPLCIGSVKTNVGHLEAAAGIAGLIKVALAMHHDRLPPSLHFDRPNPNIDFDTLHLRVVTQSQPWPAEEGALRRGGISSFGYGGTNAHAILESVPRTPSRLVASAKAPSAVAVFSGQGSQWLGMGRTLLLCEPTFRAALARCDQALAEHLDWSVLAEILAGSPRALPERLDVMWPVLFALQVALAELLQEKGCHFVAVIGHSIGEVAAAQVAGALSLLDAARVIAYQAKLVQRCVGQGQMLLAAVAWDEAQQQAQAFGGRIHCAIAASPTTTVFAGEGDALAELEAQLTARGVLVRGIKTAAAVHSPQVAYLRSDLPPLLAGHAARPARIPLVSARLGRRVRGDELDIAYFATQLCEPVRFAQGIQQLIEDGSTRFIEVSPHPIVKMSIDECLRHAGKHEKGAVVATLYRGADERQALGEAMAELTGRAASEASLTATDQPAPVYVLPISAPSEPALREVAQRLAEHLHRHDEVALRDICYTASTRRTQHSRRAVVVARDRDTLRAKLQALAEPSEPPDARSPVFDSGTRRQRVVFVFPGQGSQWVGMGQQLLAEEPVFRDAMVECDAALADEAGFSVLGELLADEAHSRLADIGVVQPVLFAIEVALAKLWRSWGIEPAGVIGHSMGEVAAAHVAGMLPLCDAAQVIARRSQLLRAVHGRGAMLLVELPLAETQVALAGHTDRLSVAASNGPRSTVISGDPTAIEQVLGALEARGIFCRRIKVDVASHSPQMDPLLDELRRLLAEIQPRSGHIPMRSTVTGALIEGQTLDAGYWAENLRAPVLFSDAIRAFVSEGQTIFLELSPHPILLPSIDENLQDLSQQGRAIASLRRHFDESQSMRESLGRLWAQHVDVDFTVLYPRGRVVALPNHPWQRQRYWLEAPPAAQDTRGLGHPLLGGQVAVAGRGAVFESLLHARHPAWAVDHRIAGRVLLPGAALVEMIHAATRTHLGTSSARVAGLTLEAPLVLPDEGGRRIQVVLSSDEDELIATIYSQLASDAPDAPWTVHARAVVSAAQEGPDAAPLDLAALRARCSVAVDPTELYAGLAAQGYEYGPAFQGIRALWRGDRELLVELGAPADATSDYALHPTVLDAAIQAALAGTETAAQQGLFLPFELGSFGVAKLGSEAAWARIRLGERAGDGELISADVVLADSEGAVVAEVLGLRLKRTRAEALRSANEALLPDALVRIAWQQTPSRRAPASREDRDILVVADAESVLARDLATRIAHCIRVEPEALLALRERAGHIAGVICLWEARPEESPPAAALRLAALGLAVVQALRDCTATRLLWVTTGAIALDAQAEVAMSAAPLWGLGRTVMQERPELGCTLVDLDPGAANAAELLLRELSDPDGENQLAYRDGRRLAARLVRVPATAARLANEAIEQGTVLITGGLGALGLHVARWLAQQGVAHLLLAGRRGLQTPRDHEMVHELERLGAQVTVAAVDVADRVALAAVLAALPAQWPLRGVIHAAGLLDDGTLGEQTAERFYRVMAPKVAGAYHIHELTEKQDLRFFVLFSSIVGTLGGGGQGNYAAANSFLDALAAHRRTRGLPAQSIAWGPWAEDGLAASLGEVHKARFARSGLLALSSSAGLGLLAHILARPEAQLGAVQLDLRAAARFFGNAVPTLWRTLVRPAAARSDQTTRSAMPQALHTLPPAERLDRLRAAVRSDVARVLALGAPEAVPLDRPFRELGLDSLMAVELRNALSQRVGMTLSATLAFDYPTVEALTRWLFGKLASENAPNVVPAAPASPASSNEPIAIIGMGCRYPGHVIDPDSFWTLLADGRDAIAEIPKTRWEIDALYDPDPEVKGKMMARSGGFLPDIDRFDAGFFGIAAREAMSMDPQQRLLLETTWEALERAALPPDRLMGSDAGVFVGLMYQEYATLSGGLEAYDGYGVTGSAASVASGRISYTLGLKGPSITVDTACSSSLVATHLACQALRQRECSLALAGGVTLMLTPTIFVEFSRLRGLSPDGRCKSFSAGADGTGWGEGCGMLVLKRLSDAQRDGDRILGLIAGSAVNQDGRSNGLTAPNGPSQEAVIRKALEQAGLRPADLDYVECHGTGTTLGDPIEAQALGAVMKQERTAERPLIIGSVKTNLGHTQAAAGVAGIIKTVLAIQHGRIPKSLHFDAPSPHIPWAELPISVASEARAWPRNGAPRRAGVSSFGVSGTNAHVVLEEAPERAPAESATPAAAPRSAALFVLSAKSPEALSAAAARLREYVAKEEGLALSDLAYSLATTRAHHEHRLAIVASSRDELGAALETAAKGSAPSAESLRGCLGAARGPLAFLFAGQGAQRLGMGRGLYADWPAFRAAWDRCAEQLDPLLPRPLHEVVWAEAGSEAAAALDQTQYTQPALFALEVALCALWADWGIRPDLLLGHSIGELAAACVAGIFTLPDAAHLVAARARLMQALPSGGSMVSISAAEAQVAAALRPFSERVSLAAVNGPDQVVIAGEEEDVAAIAASFAAQGVKTQALRVSHAFHSPRMEPMLAAFSKIAEGIAYKTPERGIGSNVLGTLVRGPQMSHAAYWTQQVRTAVRFWDGVRTLHESGAATYVEIGARATLLGLVGAALGGTAPTLLPSLRAGQKDTAAVLEALGALYVKGQPIDWERVFAAGGKRLSLPTYPWQRQRHWFEQPPASVRRASVGGHPLLGEGRAVSARTGLRLWETSLGRERVPWLVDHCVQGAILWPGAAFVEMALSAGAEACGGRPVSVAHLQFAEALVLARDVSTDVQVATIEESPGRLTFQAASRESGLAHASFAVHVRGELRGDESAQAPQRVDLAALRARLGEPMGAAAVYDALAAMGLEYGPAFQGIREAWRHNGEALAHIRLPDAAGNASAYRIHPALLDACWQVLVVALSADKRPMVPVELRRFRLLRQPSGDVFCHARLTAADPSAKSARRSATLQIFDEAGLLVAELAELVVAGLGGAASPSEQDAWFLHLAWEPATVTAPKLQGGRFVVIGEGNGLAAALRGQLTARGHTVLHADTSLAGIEAVLSQNFREKAPTAVVHVGSLDGESTLEEPAVELALRRGPDSVLHTVQAIVAMGYRDAPRLWLLSRGAQAAISDDVHASRAPLLGLLRVLCMEHPELRSTSLDLDPACPEGEVAAVVAELQADDAEQEIALRGEARAVARLVRRLPESVQKERLEPAHGRSFRLESAKPGVLDELVLKPIERRPPGSGEVEIEVAAAGLNFLDVLLAMGVMPNDGPTATPGALTLGSECSGHVVAIGENVTGLVVGQPVIALAPAAFASHITTSERLVLPLPAGMSLSQAAALPVVFLTAWIALDKVARLRKGERVLIHSATGGVGLAALQWAQHVGAEIYATAGSPEKRAHLEALGIRYISDSRSDRFVADVLAWTGGEGVDVVLNSLSGELIEKSFGLLRSYGRFIEIGKRDYYANSQLGLRPFLRNLSFSLVDLRGMMLERPTWVRERFAELLDLFASGVLSPLPVEEFPISRTVDAFRKMAQGQHLGKLVLTLREPDVKVSVGTTAGVSVRRGRSYLVTGGLGGLGLKAADWLAQRSAEHLVLVGRSGITRAEQRTAIASIVDRGARVTVVHADIADRGAVARLLADIAASGQPLAGILHAAGVLDDGLLLRQSPARFRKVMGPKLWGALHLHTLTQAQPLDFFVMYASAAGLLGTPGQGNYAAANTFLDALAHHRRAHGLPATSIDWGAFSGVGMAAQEDRDARLGSRGLRSLTPLEGLTALERLLKSGAVQAGVLPLDLRQWIEFYPAAATSSLLTRLLAEQQDLGKRSQATTDLALRLSRAAPAQRHILLEELLRGEVAKVMRIPVDKFEPAAPLASLGMDSLMSLELRNRIEAALGTRVPSTLLWTYPSVAALSKHFAAEFGLAEPAPPAAREDTAIRESPSAVEDMSSEELLAFITQTVGALS